MDIFAHHAQAALMMLVMTGTVFGVLALLVKRQAIGAALKRVRGEFTTNLGLLLFNLVLIAPLFALPEGLIRDRIVAIPALGSFWDTVSEPAVLVIAILVYDFVVYWRHRAEHHPLLWPIHATHHADTALHWLSVQRKHPLSKLLGALVDVWLLLLLGFPEWAIAGANFLRSWWAFFIHADVPWTLGIFGKVLISPAAHRLHHIRDEALMGSNYGNTVTLWDKLFGTYVDPAPYLNCETGIAEGTRGFLGELGRPFEKRYWKREADPAIETEATT
ncbi:sterol desaturase family protein [Qipengyuania qiaonensis]|uniref:Sterol desaturase family protein n=1 Tax=Qipengyuania qiaonensis TaxID=2867240 RepID=A0ABS7J5U5_9SPHN|nr:sterol desaturase family protein [Qipengyuania qiaonensis]MBX7480988.1 sterol desaturase family protein [Qipengyuania qiaonensis]